MHPNSSNENYLYVTGEDLLNFHSNRSSIQIYTIHNNKLYFLLGFCSKENIKQGNLSDFGGSRKHNETSAITAIREFNEESKHIFGQLSIQQFFTYFSVIRQGPLRSKNRKCGPNATTKAITSSNIIKNRESSFNNKEVDSEMTITFMYVENKWLFDATQSFNNLYSDRPECNEILDIIWIIEEGFIDLVKNKYMDVNHVMWNKLRRFYSPIINKVISSLKEQHNIV